MAKKTANESPSEKLLLIILSLISIGLLVAIIYVWYNALSGAKPASKPGDFLNTPTKTLTNTASPSVQPKTNIPLSIASPQDQDIVTTAIVAVTGQTLAKAGLTITGGKDDVASQADETGAFAEKVTLNEGDNTLVVTAFDQQGNQTSKTLNLIYSP